jgi:acyl-CoA synthetase (AMP-forming)/AMP-acid ligase II
MQTTPPELKDEYRRRGWWSETRIQDLFDAAVTAHPARLALADAPNRTQLAGGTPLRLTWAQLDELVDAVMLRLLELGLRRDDILITQLPNIAEYVAVYIAALKLGIILSPVPMQFRRHELEQIIGLTGARALLTLVHFKATDPTADALAAAREHAAGTQVIVLDGVAPAGTVALAPLAPDAAARESLRSLLRDVAVSADDIATICWTSGTEGRPKGVPRSHNHWTAISHGHFDGAGIRPGDILLNPFPLVNMAALGGCFMSWLRSAGTLLLHHPLDLPVYLAQIARERPQYAIAPPAVLNMLLKDERLLAMTDLASLRCIGSGSAPLDPSMIRGFRDRFGIEVVNMFGSNEGMSLVSGATEAPDPEQRATMFPRFGRADVSWPQRCASMIRTRLIDPLDGHEILDPGHAGEMQIRGPTVFDGYFRAPELTAAAFSADGWFRTGDLFEIPAEEGATRYYRFVGRLKQLIVRGGVKIAPEEIEAVLARHPDIAEASAVAYRDAVMGERICAVIVPRVPGGGVPIESLQALFRAAAVALFKCPERVRYVESLPRNAVGKVIRSALTPLAEKPD